jgi:hypothetical protein
MPASCGASAAVMRRRVREGTFPVPAVQFGGKTSTIMFERAVERHFRPVANADSKELAEIQALNEAGLTVGQAVTVVNVMKCSDLTGAEPVATAFPTRWTKA